MTKVLSRDVLHNNSGTADKVYIVERLEGSTGAQAFFTSYGKRGGTLKSLHVPATEASKKLTEKLTEGYKPKSSTVGLTPAEKDTTVPLTDAAVYSAVLGAAASTPAATSTGAAPVVEPPKPVLLSLNDLEREFGSIDRLGNAKDVTAASITANPDGTFTVQGTDAYTVTLNPLTCTCPSFVNNSPKPCKHLVAVVRVHGEGWLRSKRSEETLAAMDLATPAPAAAAAPAAAPAGNPVMALFAPYVKAGEAHALVPDPESLRWDMAHARRLSSGFKRRKPTLLFGPTGTGKTSMPRAFGALTNRPVMRINCTRDTTKLDIIGHPYAANGSTGFEYGPLPLAMKYGYILIVDEADRMDAGVSSTLFPAMEDFPSLTLKEANGEVIKADPDFWMVLTANGMGLHDEAGIYTGSEATDAALVSRCGVQIQVGYPAPALEMEILVNRGVPSKVAERVTKASVAIRKMLESGAVKGAWGTRHAINFAENSIDLGSYKEGFAATAEAPSPTMNSRPCGAWPSTKRAPPSRPLPLEPRRAPRGSLRPPAVGGRGKGERCRETRFMSDFFSSTNCDRCGAAFGPRIMSKFNRETICSACKADERLAPGFAAADAAEIASVRAGAKDFPGVGLGPDDLAFLAARRAARQSADHSGSA